MASISVRKLDDHIYLNLRARAAKHGVSMEEEVRQIISQVVSPPASLGLVFQKNFGSQHGIDLEKRSQNTPHEPLEF